MAKAATASKRVGRPRRSWRQRLIAVAPGLVATVLILLLQALDLPMTGEIGNLVFDAYERAAPRPYKEEPVRVIDIDDTSIAKLGQWPWPRTDIARLNQVLAQAGAATVAYDVIFSEPDRTSPARLAKILRNNPEASGDYAEIARLPDHDAVLGKAVSSPPTVLGLFLTNERNAARPPEKAGFAFAGTPPMDAIAGFNGSIDPLPVISDKAAGVGFVSIVGQQDGIVRSVPLIARVGDQITPALSIEALRVAQGAGSIIVKSNDAAGELGGRRLETVAVKTGALEVPTTKAGELWMYYSKPEPSQVVPAWKVLSGAMSADQLKAAFGGRIVLVGTGAAGLRDLVATPFSKNELGVVVHAQAIEQILSQSFLIRPDWAPGAERFLILVLGLAMALALPSLGALRGGVFALAAFGGSAAASWYAFHDKGLLLDPTFPALGTVAVYMSATLYSFFSEERARAYIHRAFDRYLSPELVDRIARDPSQLKLGGEEREMTVLFCDIRSFSRISEKLTPQAIIQFLIAFLTPMTEVLLARKATIDKYMGDAILAFWNAPLDDPDHERNAAFAALEMIEKLKAMNADPSLVRGAPWPGVVKIGVGLSAGRACVGNMGSDQRLNYSLIGDTVNLASRLEGLTKFYGTTVVINSRLAQKLSDFATIEIDLVRVVGRDTPERVFALLGAPSLAASPGFKAAAAGWSQVLTTYRAADFAGAKAAIERFADLAKAQGLETLAELYAKRISHFLETPPATGWDGVFEATEK